ncbi:MAG: glycosyltransferase family 2 protein [Bdellovibrionales bacterium]|nr:glycosyltransferase family 2 protein [Bdellovibrionales bacterium]
MSLVSIVIPLFNEEDNVEALYQELTSVAAAASLNCQFVFVDDGSSDQTVSRLMAIAGDDERVMIVNFRRNFGQTAAMAAGFDFADGDIIVTMDGDLQNDPAEIPNMIAKLEEGYDMVAGWRKNRQDKFLSRKLPSMIANRIISSTTNVRLHDYGCTLKVMRSEVAKNIQLYGEMHRFIPALAAELGVKVAEVPVNHRARVAGTSKYGISRTFRVLLDLLTVKFFLGFSTRPLHMFGMLGMVTGAFGFLILGWLAIERLIIGLPIGGRPMLMLGSMLVLIGLQFICFGLLAEVMVRTYHESQNKKIYTVREVLRGGKDGSTRKIAHVG